MKTEGGIGLGLSPYENEQGVIHHVRQGGNGEAATIDSENGPQIGLMLEDRIVGYRYLDEHNTALRNRDKQVKTLATEWGLSM